MIVPTQVGGIFTADKGATLGAFANYMLCEGQQQAAALGYSPLPRNLVEAGIKQINRIPGAEATGANIDNCNNPTFKPGDTNATNQLAVTAPQPAACDKQGPDQCVTGTGGATDSTPVSGSGAGGSAAGGDAAAATDATAAGAASGGEAVYDENGALLAGGVSGGAVSSPFTLADDGFGTPQYVMLFAGVLVVLAVVLPPVLSRRLKRSGSGTPL
jgi:phosphate transport system substrate-binding protein